MNNPQNDPNTPDLEIRKQYYVVTLWQGIGMILVAGVIFSLGAFYFFSEPAVTQEEGLTNEEKELIAGLTFEYLNEEGVTTTAPLLPAVAKRVLNNQPIIDNNWTITNSLVSTLVEKGVITYEDLGIKTQ